MAFLRQARTENEIKRMTVSNVKKAYNELAADYNKIINRDYLFCPSCNEFLSKNLFYKSKWYASGYYPECKQCLLMEVRQQARKTDPPNETKESVQRVLRKMNLPYMDGIYEHQCQIIADDVNEQNRSSPFLQYLTTFQSLPQYRNKTWADSDFGNGVISEDEEIKLSVRTVKNGRKRFGSGYTDADYMFLESEYQDWISRYPCETKAQELLFQRICCNELLATEAQKQGQPTDKFDKNITDLMSAAGIKPSQSSSNTLTEAKTFGQLIDKWEQEKPVPEPEPEFRDVDKVGWYIRVFFAGCLSKMFGWKQGYTPEYDNYLAQYSVDPSHGEDEDNDASGALWDTLFGEQGEGES